MNIRSHIKTHLLHCSLCLFFAFTLFSCVKEQKRHEKTNNNYLPAPVKIRSSSPIITIIDTCQKPNIIHLPVNSKGECTLQTINGPQVKSIYSSVIPIHGGEFGGFSFMQNFNTEQGLALSSINCSYKDKNGNLWFGTAGGGVSKYDGKSFTNFTSSQGLANNMVKCIIEDRSGNMWFGTIGGGISKYDGKKITTFTTEDGLAHNRISSITEDRRGNIWFSTDNGISKYDPNINKNATVKSFTNFTIAQGLVSNNITTSTIDKNGNIWFGTDKGISKCNPLVDWRNDTKYFTNYTIEQGLSNNFVLSSAEDKEGNIWFGTNDGLSKYSQTIKDGIVDYTFTNFDITHGLIYNNIRCIAEDSKGNLWFGTGNGMSKYNPTIAHTASSDFFTNFTTEQGLSQNIVNSIIEDDKGSIWVGSSGKGLSKYDGTSIISYTVDQGLPFSQVWSIAQDKKENLWFATNSGISRYDGHFFTNYDIRGIMNSLRFAFEDKMGNIWLGSSLGVTKYDGKFFTNYNMAQGFPHNTVLSIVEDKIGNLWFGTYGAGVCKYDGNRIDAIEREGINHLTNLKDLKKVNGEFVKTFTTYSTAQGLAGNTIKCIVEDKKGNLWLGTNGNGVSKFDGTFFTNYSKEQGLPQNTVLSILEDRSGALWFGSAGGGVCKYDPSVNDSIGSALFTTYTSAQGLANDVVYAIKEDTLNNIIWFGTNLGLSGLKLNSLSHGAADVIFENFNYSAGYPIKDLNTSALLMDKKGIIWAGTSDKLVRFDYKAVSRSIKPPAVFIQAVKIRGEEISWYNLKYGETEADSLKLLNEEVMVFGRPLNESQRDDMRESFIDVRFDSITPFYPLPQNLVLPFKDNNITFDFLAIETARPFMVNYQYILEGYDHEWSKITNKTSATFGNIQEGDYTFKLKAQSPEGIWSDYISYTFKVTPPWYRTWWMYVTYLSSALLFIGLFIRWRERNLQMEKVILENKVELRTKELEEKNKIVEEQKEIVLEKNLKITDSINYAKRIQHAILPSEELIRSYLPDSFIFYRPKDIVSGDFYWFTSNGSKLIIAIADCTGHGVPGAFMSMIGNTLLNEIVNVKNISEPNQILDHLNKGVVSLLHQATSESVEQDDGMDISILAIDKTNNEIEYAGANHIAYLFNPTLQKTLKGDVFSIGGMFGKTDINFSSQKVKVEKGATIYLFTDGFMDQFGGEKNTKFLSSNFLQLLQNVQSYDLDEQKRIIDAAFNSWKGNIVQTDDVLVMGIRM
ncbi:MAG: two-component regulator propeller domain-containing protein [Bacteroidota bacterium]|nr:two-component regulator propeller domain-containing protein [Bacteroidota bacterium]